MSLQDQLDAFKSDFEGGKAPAAAVSIMHKATSDLIASGQAERALKAGAVAPAFSLPDSTGNAVTLHQLLLCGPLVLTFYRGVWCPYCNLDLKALEAASTEIRARGATLVAISPQTAANSEKSRRDNELDFPILTDQGSALADAFGLRFRLPEPLIGLYRSFGVDLPGVNGDDSWTLPMPARYVIGRDGIIAYAEVNPDYTRRPDPSELLPTLDRLRAAAIA